MALCVATFLLCALCGTALAEIPDPAARPDRGVRPVGSYSISDIENISLTNGNLNLSIPLAGLPPIAGSKLSWIVRAIYNSRMYDARSNEWESDFYHPQGSYTRKELQFGTAGGWTVGGAYTLSLQLASQDYSPLSTGCIDPPACTNTAYRFKMILTTPDGAQHELRPMGYQSYGGLESWRIGYYQITPATLQQTMAYYSFDGSYLWAAIQKWGDPINDPASVNTSPNKWDVYLPDGTRIKKRGPNQSIIDMNNNQIQIFTETAGTVSTTHYQDLTATGVQREILYVFNSSTNTGYVRYQKVDGGTVDGTVDINLNWGVTQPQGLIYNAGDHVCPTVAESLDVDIPVLRSIVLPQTEQSLPSQQFAFNYNSDTTFTQSVQWQPFCAQTLTTNVHSSGWGSLGHIDMPSGARVDYKYSRDLVPGPGSQNDIRAVLREGVVEKKITHLDNSFDTWAYTAGFTIGTVTGPDNAVTTEYYYSHDPAHSHSLADDGRGGLVYRTDRSGKEMIERRWEFRKFTGSDGAAPNGVVGFNPVVVAEYTTFVGTPSSTSKMSAKLYDYDYNGNLVKETDYALFPASSVQHDGTPENLPTGVPAGTPKLREVTNTFYNPATAAGDGTVYGKRDLNAATVSILNALKETSAGDGVTQFSNTQFAYDNSVYGTTPSIGNLTEVSQWDNLHPGTRIITTNTYDAYGNIASVTDPSVNIKKFFYDDFSHAQPNRIVVNPGTTAQTEQTTTIVYDYNTGRVKSQTDANGQITTTDYTNQRMPSSKDPYGRPGVVIGPAITSTTGGLNQHHKTVTTYYDSARQVVVEADLNAEGDLKLKSRTTHDDVGRVMMVENSEDGSTYSVTTEAAYDLVNRITYAGNPRRTGAASTDGWTRSTSDSVGRVVEVATFNGAAKPTATATNWNGHVLTSYNAEQTTVTDQAGKKRRSVMDALGRVVRVDEPDSTSGNLDDTANPPQPLQPTSYAYDPLDNLKSVTQSTQPQRTFNYDSLKRLSSASNPESGTVNYEYYANSNLKKKTDARGVQIEYFYDRMNRATSRTYSSDPQNTPAVNYYYDAQSLPTGAPSFARGASIGRLVAALYGGSTSTTGSYQGYDAAGRATISLQNTDAQLYQMSYGYDLASNMTRETYPSGREVITEYDSAGRAAAARGGALYYAGAPATDSANRIQYAAHGAISVTKLGNGKWEHADFNSRLQPTQIGLGTSSTDSSTLKLEYGYGTTTNNGNVLSQTITAPQTGSGNLILTQGYTYDKLNRLTIATENSGTTWSQNYGYDRYGNRWVSQSTGYSPDPTLCPTQPSHISATTNRIVMAGFSYDAAGNQKTQIRNSQNENYDYDAENRLVKINNGAIGQYFYDGEGRRVKKIDNGGTTVFAYDVTGRLVAEYHSDPLPPVQGGGGTSYLTTDHLGSTRVVTNSTGGVKARYDYLPFGEQIGSTIGRGNVAGYGGADSTKQKFTQKERDSESGLDYFLARYYSSAQGRFTSADVLFADQKEHTPQSWNLYVYTRNNPTNYVDPNGNSTHTNKDGVVVAVYDDDDVGVYRHDNLKKWNGKSTLANAGKGVAYMGETLYWDEFRAHDNKTGAILPDVAKGARIMFGQEFDTDVERLNADARKMDLRDVAANSTLGKKFDIKSDTTIAPYGPNTGKTLGGYFVTARSAGNYLEGYNAATSKFRGDYIDSDTNMKMAGALQQGKFSKINAAKIFLFGTAYGPAPYYGEIEYSGRQIARGFHRGVGER